ncbi:MAG: hypothetical protein H0U67_11595, partial [Gemmatimonadetes bacterium]|nr:hypothetical protein [Gemmatimonadota bacterium]
MVQGDCRSPKTSSRAGFLALVILLGLAVSVPTSAQEATAREEPLPASLDSLVTHAIAVHPRVRAAMERIAAARAAIGPAGALPDPMLAVGISNFPVSEPGFEDFMTMK